MPGPSNRPWPPTATTTRPTAAVASPPRSWPVSEATLTETDVPDEHGPAADDHAAHVEYTDDKGHPETSTGLSNNKLAMWLFLGSECLLFGGLISTYMLYRGRHTGTPGPAQLWDIPLTSVSSFVLLM